MGISGFIGKLPLPFDLWSGGTESANEESTSSEPAFSLPPHIQEALNSGKLTVENANRLFEIIHEGVSKEPRSIDREENPSTIDMPRSNSPSFLVPLPKSAMKGTSSDLLAKRRVLFSSEDRVADSNKKELYSYKSIRSVIQQALEPSDIFAYQNPRIASSFIEYIAKYTSSRYEELKEKFSVSSLDKIFDTIKREILGVIEKYNNIETTDEELISDLSKGNPALNVKEKNNLYLASYIDKRDEGKLVKEIDYLVTSRTTQYVLNSFYQAYPDAFQSNQAILPFAMFIALTIRTEHKVHRRNKVQHEEMIAAMKTSLPKEIQVYADKLKKSHPKLTSEELATLKDISIDLLDCMPKA